MAVQPMCPRPCPNRKVGCQGSCEIHKEFLEKLKAEKEAIQKSKMQDNEYFGYAKSNIIRLKR